ncbi:hypothetical protein WR25_21744 [Diploscapter pachys]|uniref:DUF19 domain-containing protein n=1 Tax=Diploscapter pachys TaxID=2018661 RepID=A0A2A2JHL1_9BILA|nr:hypothetical protein WR25_21744 [Diploscapter pachys]
MRKFPHLIVLILEYLVDFLIADIIDQQTLSHLSLEQQKEYLNNRIPFPIPPPLEFREPSDEIVNQCRHPQTVYTCYVNFAEKYGIHPSAGYLPFFRELNHRLRITDLVNICKDFNDLTNCLGVAQTYCINLRVFYMFAQRYRQRTEALNYLENHAFYEFACTRGRIAFFSNIDCLSQAFQVAPLTDRMLNCGQDRVMPGDPNVCTNALMVTQCVKQQLQSICPYGSGVAACGAAVQIGGFNWTN